MKTKVNITAFMSCAFLALSACSGEIKTATPIDVIVTAEHIQSGMVVLSAEPSVVKAMMNIGVIEQEANACDKISALTTYFEENHENWLNLQGYEQDTQIEMDMIEVLTFDEYNKAKDVKPYGTISFNASGETVFISSKANGC